MSSAYRNRIAAAILDDLLRRDGIGDAFDDLDDEIMQEIKDAISAAAIAAMVPSTLEMQAAGRWVLKNPLEFDAVSRCQIAEAVFVQMMKAALEDGEK
ncbi:MAG: hypothetical protein WDN46_13765 [Methylocella sp.]